MRFIKTSTRTRPVVSLVLLDWGVRESFHLFDYLKRQTADRDDFEILLIEYYAGVSPAAEKYADEIDGWALLEMPPDTYYHKHLMYNVGIELARGEIVMIGDSDAMVRESFIQTIIDAFKRDPEIVFHIDQFRNVRRDLYPFCWPSFEEVLGDGCINNVGGKTAGVAETRDPLHQRNYGACMCARREDLIAIGGADEHIDYLGHICGPYDMTFRLVNLGRREIWSEEEFTYHTWHPGQAGADNYLGPHDGRHMSTTSLQALLTGRVLPLLENATLRARRTGEPLSDEAALSGLIRPEAASEWLHQRLDHGAAPISRVDAPSWVATCDGARILQDQFGYVVEGGDKASDGFSETVVRHPTIAAARAACADRLSPRRRDQARAAARLARLIRVVSRSVQTAGSPGALLSVLRRRLSRLLSGGAAGATIEGGVGVAGPWSEEADFVNLVMAFLARAEAGSPLRLAVAGRANALAIRLLCAIGRLPPTEVAVVDDVRAAQRLADGDQPILIQGLAYTRYYPILRPLIGRRLFLA